MRLKPLHNKIVVKPSEKETQTASGLFIQTSKEEGIVEGHVVAVGPGTYDNAGKFLDVALDVGDRVLFNLGSGYKVKVDGEGYQILTDDEIVMVLE